MIKLISGATFALLAATSVQAMTPAPMPRPDSLVTRVAFGCGAGQTLVNGQCVARWARRQARRADYGTYSALEAAGAGARLYVAPFVGAGNAYYTAPHYSPYNEYTAGASGLSWYAARAYYAGGPWYFGTRGWADYAAREGIGCTPGTLVKGGDGVMYVCQ